MLLIKHGKAWLTNRVTLQNLIQKLKPGGRMVIPVGAQNSLQVSHLACFHVPHATAASASYGQCAASSGSSHVQSKSPVHFNAFLQLQKVVPHLLDCEPFPCSAAQCWSMLPVI